MVTVSGDVNVFERQMDLELEMRERGALRDKKKEEQSENAVNESLTIHGKKLLKASIDNYMLELDLWLNKVNSGQRPIAAKLLEQLDTKTIAVIATKKIIDGITSVRKYTSQAIELGGKIEDELYFREYAIAHPALFDTVDKDLNSRSSHYGYRRSKHLKSSKKVNFQWNWWETREKLLVGEQLLSLFIKATNLCMVQKNWKRNRSFFVIVPTEQTLKWIKNVKDFNEYLNPEYMPTLVKPKPWVAGKTKGAGYFHIKTKPILMVSGHNITSHRNFLDELANYDMPGIIDGMNAVQNTMYKVNKDILLVAETVFNNDDRNRGGLVTSSLIDLPNKPHDIDTNKESLLAWKAEAVTVYTINQKLKSKRLATAKTLWIANKFQNEHEIGFPVQLDFRSRLYYIPPYLNPQGTDLAKSLLKFANAKPIGKSGYKWLCIHLSNMYGNDKVTLDAREKWALDNKDQIIACSQAPFENNFWESADKPWQFLAACMEFDKVNEFGLEYKSNLPISIDGTCNGLQHFSALFTDEIGGVATNLTNTEAPKDIYQLVCNKVIEELKKSDNPIAKQWLDFGIDRKCTKRPVMVLPYGGNRWTFTEFVDEYVEGRIAKGDKSPFGNRTKSNIFLAAMIEDAIKETVIKATEAMQWLQQIAKLVSKEAKPVHWTTPLGFPVRQAYYDQKDLIVKTKMMGRLRIKSSTDKIHKRKQTSGISPNFIHALDATSMFLTIDHAIAEGITDFAMVHDSYSTVAADIDTLGKCTREAFIQLYTEVDPIELFEREIKAVIPEESHHKIPKRPSKGTLDMDQIRNAKYFFC
ncbi:RNA polymerase [uncultured phage_MedDCM-OCT-S28-C10]|uniref:DNA-directed RNA polymerase n=1 Tax=uncultured phage_MedDCM-OCT-S28-C10 TaxID=2741077 RepID=A0A6S4PAE2_9CAUD|nr:N4-like RNA polymerase [uncultured phage_MedDCM-OCT-S28-C10]BAQ94080.1 RNA polymerase [uncultured phage_MedDCM-OCT-S28-C10]BAR25282.1 RNA polymerase [uncultured Mediterranean phage uvMED]BAR25307.1 RNA polymerase [uncultured Mediterranean phage uvMED]